jgi:Fic-DOC domain mobile mystery protein B
LPPINIKADVDLAAEFRPIREINNEIRRLTLGAYWVEHKTFPQDEIAVRFHHGLVAVHPFPNGNGRWSRLMGDILAVQLGQTPFTWSGGAFADAGELRAQYIAALRAADSHDFTPLVGFARS